jgi:putative membrane protein
MWWTDYWPMPWMLIGPLMMLLLLVAGAALMFFILRGGMARGPSHARAIEIVADRFARGEISRAEYDELRGLLRA